MANKAAVDQDDGNGNGSKDRPSSPVLAVTRAGDSVGKQAECPFCSISPKTNVLYCTCPCIPQVPVAHCFISFGVYKKKFCQVCRKLLEESFACRCEVCEMHLHVECLRFASSDCRKCHHEHHTEQVLAVHHWQEGNLPTGSRCESCRKACASHEVLCSQRCLWCHVTAHSSCCASISDCCSFGRLEGIMLPPFCVTLHRPFTLQDVLFDPGKQTLKVFDGDDAIRSGQFRYISVPRICKEGEVVEAALREYHLSSKAEDYELHSLLQDAVVTSAGGDLCSNGHPQESGAPGDAIGTVRQPFGDAASEAYIIRRWKKCVGSCAFMCCFPPHLVHLLKFTDPLMGCAGNDLARVLRWGPGYTGEDPSSVLTAVQDADVVHMDRWTVLLDSYSPEQAEGNSALPQIVQMNNYLGIGVDADLTLSFHNAREEEPEKFKSRFHNKGVYLKVGLQKMSSSRSLHRDIKIQVDGVDIDLPGIEGIILLNIPSWGSGADLWGSESDSSYEKPQMDDGKLEVVGVTGVIHMGQVQSRLRSGIRIAQGTFIRLILHREVAIQVDGEPWTQPPGTIIVSLTGTKVRMLKKCKQRHKKGSLKDARSDAGSGED
uniref:diacylglycerol kinase (ATP) n=1 Tax=Eptatretus burgeri TaxID=7764 RepID=A0A8C4RBF3_EPTBU